MSSIFSTGIEAILLIVNNHIDSIYVDLTFMLFIFITFLLLVSTISRYYLFNKNPARIASLYIYRVIKKNKLSEDKFHEFVNLISYLKGTKNKEFLILIIRRINEIEFKDTQYSKKIAKGLKALGDNPSYPERYLMSFDKKDENRFRQYKLLVLLYKILNTYDEDGADLFNEYAKLNMKTKLTNGYLLKEPINKHEEKNYVDISNFEV